MRLMDSRRSAKDGQHCEGSLERPDIRQESLMERLRKLLNRDGRPGHLGMAAAGLGDFDSWRDGHGGS